MALKMCEMLMSNEHYAYYPFAYFLEQQAAMGSKCLELFLAPPHVWVDWRGAEGIAELREKIQAAGLRVDAVRAEGVSQRYAPFAAEEERARRSLAYYRRCADVAQALGARVMTVTPVGVYRDEASEPAFARAARQLRAICEAIAPTGVTLALENLAPNALPFLMQAQAMRRMLAEVAHPGLACALNTVGMSEAGETFEQWFEQLGGRIACVRLSDGRSGPEALVCGQGIYPMERYVAQLDSCGFDGPVVLPLGRSYSNDPAAADRKNRAAFSALLREGAAQ
ncbi:MAG TPA: sugar phosphate isomerase/epimerase [Candidatus Aphodomonas merdavium]|nr:sugar phosphate isomerase/epimerase [Candidatus Aphodomonas merdavium]